MSTALHTVWFKVYLTVVLPLSDLLSKTSPSMFFQGDYIYSIHGDLICLLVTNKIPVRVSILKIFGVSILEIFGVGLVV